MNTKSQLKTTCSYEKGGNCFEKAFFPIRGKYTLYISQESLPEPYHIQPLTVPQLQNVLALFLFLKVTNKHLK